MTTVLHRENAMTALRLQRERSSAYQQWTSLFYRAVVGDITPSELHCNIQGIILPQFQRVSTHLRTLQAAQREADGTASNGGASATASKADPARGLVAWIERLQELEQEHYKVTLSLANQLVAHCGPNVCATEKIEDPTVPPDTSDKRAATTSDLRALFKPDDPEDHDNNGDDAIEYRAQRDKLSWKVGATPAQPDPTTTSAAPPSSPPQPTLCVHDNAECLLLHLIPPCYHRTLYFVECHRSVDALGSSFEDSLSDEEEEKRQGGGDATPLSTLFAKEAHAAATEGSPQKRQQIAEFNPAAVARRCRRWSWAVAEVARRQAALRSAIEDMCDELQGDISDSA